MAKISVYNQAGEVIEQLEINPAIFDITPDKNLLEEAVRTHLANRRVATAQTKDKSEVRGGGRKPWKQKGTGRARHGSIRSPIWRGGGVTFGPTTDRNWSLKMNKRASRKALFMALTDKVRSKKFFVIDKIELPEAKTRILHKSLTDFLAKTNGSDRSVMFVIPGKSETMTRASRNMATVVTTQANNLNVYDILNARSVVILKEALPVIEKTFGAGDKQ